MWSERWLFDIRALSSDVNFRIDVAITLGVDLPTPRLCHNPFSWEIFRCGHILLRWPALISVRGGEIQRDTLCNGVENVERVSAAVGNEGCG